MPDDQLKVAVPIVLRPPDTILRRECRILGLIPGIAIAHFFCLCETGRGQDEKNTEGLTKSLALDECRAAYWRRGGRSCIAKF